MAHAIGLAGPFGRNPDVYDELARALAKRGNRDAAIAAAQKALESKPDHTNARLLLSSSLGIPSGYQPVWLRRAFEAGGPCVTSRSASINQRVAARLVRSDVKNGQIGQVMCPSPFLNQKAKAGLPSRSFLKFKSEGWPA